MNRYLNKSIRYCIKSYKLFPQRVLYRFSASNIDFNTLKESFKKNQDMFIFNEVIVKSNNSLDNINYFKIFKILEDNRSPIKHYEDFFHQVNSTVTKKSDNMRMLLAKVRAKIAKKH